MPNLITFHDRIKFGETPSVFIFNHIPKCAGTTFYGIINKKFASLNFFINGHKGWIQIWEMLKIQGALATDIALSGHHTWGIHELFGKKVNCFYYTLLHHPLEIIISDYHFCKRLFYTLGSLNDFARSYSANPLISWLGNGSLPLAKERLLNVYFAFGIVDFFDESMRMLEHLGILDGIDYEIKNKSRENRPELGDGLLDFLRHKHADDISFYEWAVELFSERMLQFPPNGSASLNQRSQKAVYTNSSKKIAELFTTADISEGIKSLEQWPHKKAGHMRTLANHYWKTGNFDKAEYWYLKTIEQCAPVSLELAQMYSKTSPKKMNEFICNILDSIADIYSQFPDSYLNVFRARCRQILKKCQKTVSMQ